MRYLSFIPYMLLALVIAVGRMIEYRTVLCISASATISQPASHILHGLVRLDGRHVNSCSLLLGERNWACFKTKEENEKKQKQNRRK